MKLPIGSFLSPNWRRTNHDFRREATRTEWRGFGTLAPLPESPTAEPPASIPCSTNSPRTPPAMVCIGMEMLKTTSPEASPAKRSDMSGRCEWRGVSGMMFAGRSRDPDRRSDHLSPGLIADRSGVVRRRQSGRAATRAVPGGKAMIEASSTRWLVAGQAPLERGTGRGAISLALTGIFRRHGQPQERRASIARTACPATAPDRSQNHRADVGCKRRLCL